MSNIMNLLGDTHIMETKNNNEYCAIVTIITKHHIRYILKTYYGTT